MSIESQINFCASSPVLDDFENIPDFGNFDIFGNDFAMDIFRKFEVGHEPSPSEQYGNEWMGSEWQKSDDEEFIDEFFNSTNIDILLGECDFFDLIVGESQVSPCDVKGVGSATAFGLLDEIEKGEFSKQEKDEPEESIIKSVRSLGSTESRTLISKETENINLTTIACSPKTKQKPKTSKVKPKSKGTNKGGKYRPQKSNCQPQSNESCQVMTEHDYVVRDTNVESSTPGAGKVGTVSRLDHNTKNRGCKEIHESSASNKNSIPVEQKFISALDAKVAPKPRLVPIPRKDGSVSGSNLKPKPAPVPRKGSIVQDQTLEQKPRLAPVPRKDVKSEQKPKPAPVPRKMTSILDNSKLIKSIQEQDDYKRLTNEGKKSFKDSDGHKSLDTSLESCLTSPNDSRRPSPKENEKDRCSSMEETSAGDLQQNETNDDGKDKNKKKLSLMDYKKLKQERHKQEPGTDEQSKTNETSNEGDHNYCMTSQCHQTSAETSKNETTSDIETSNDATTTDVGTSNNMTTDIEMSNRMTTEQSKAVATTTVVTKPTSPHNIEIESKKSSHSTRESACAAKVEDDRSRNRESFRNQLPHTRPFRDPNRRFEDNNIRKRRASPLHNSQLLKRTTKDDSQYSNGSWNTSVLTVFELPRRNGKYSNSAGFPSDASSLSSPCQRSRSRSSSVSSNSSSSSVSSSSRREKHIKNTRSRAECSRERRDNNSSRKSLDQQKAIEERRIVYVGGLPSDYTKYDLRRKMQCFGEILETSIHKRNKDEYYGFVTFETTAQAANAKQDGPRVPGCERFDFSYGGRREFCGTNYSDLDHEAVYRSSSSMNSKNSDFQDLLRQTMSMVQKSKRTS